MLTHAGASPTPGPVSGGIGIAVPQSAPQEAPVGADSLHVLIRDVHLDGAFPELEADLVA